MYLSSKLLRLVTICSLIFSVPGFAYAVNVKDFGARGDGKTDDTYAINKAISECSDGLVEFPRGSYRITQTVFIDLSKNGPLGLSGLGASAGIIMEGEGPAFCFIGNHQGSADPASVKPETWMKERMPLIDALEIVGSNPNADGIKIRNTLMPVFSALLIRNVRNGLHFTRDLEITGNDIEYNCDPAGSVSADVWIDCSQGGSVREGTISGNTIQAIPSRGGANIRFTGLPVIGI